MNHMQFIEKHIKQKLTEAGYSAAIAQGGANVGVDHYRRCSQASKKGAMFRRLSPARQSVGRKKQHGYGQADQEKTKPNCANSSAGSFLNRRRFESLCAKTNAQRKSEKSLAMTS